MTIMPEQGSLRPPSEAGSLFVRVTRNCPWNRCTFCPGFKAEKFSLRPVEEILDEIRKMAGAAGGASAKTVFLQDADALVAPQRDLLCVLDLVRRSFPRVERVTAYSRSSTLAGKSPSQLRELRAAGLDRVHIGFESGSDAVLKAVLKGVTAARQLEGCRKIKKAGFELCCYFMPGLGGVRLSASHAEESGRLLAEISPDHVRLRTTFILEGTPLAGEYAAGVFEPLGEEGMAREIRRVISMLGSGPTEIASDHRMNLLLELNGRLPEAKEKLLGTIDRFLALAKEEKELFIAGRRAHLIKRLDDLYVPEKRALLDKLEIPYKALIPAPLKIFY